MCTRGRYRLLFYLLIVPCDATSVCFLNSFVGSVIDSNRSEIVSKTITKLAGPTDRNMTSRNIARKIISTVNAVIVSLILVKSFVIDRIVLRERNMRIIALHRVSDATAINQYPRSG